jgi:endonuclease YncB( thermonuclease family)
MGSLGALLRRFALAVPLILGAVEASAQTRAKTDYTLEAVASGAAIAVRDGRTFVLENGREVRLAGIEIPRTDAAESVQAKNALETLIRGQILTLKAGAEREDRYGRAGRGRAGRQGKIVQAQMVAAGYARASGSPNGCGKDLLAAEKIARDGRLGLWSGPAFQPAAADRPAEVLARKWHFALVDGTVMSVRKSGGLIYVNFGRRFTRDFTVTILRRNQRLFSAASVDPKQLEGRRIRVRGVIEQRGGPLLEATRPEQIELANESHDRVQ